MLQPVCHFGGCLCQGSRALLRRSPAVWTFFSVNHASLSELVDDAAPLIAVFREPNLGLFLKGNEGFTDFEGLQEARPCQERKKLCRSPAGRCEMFSKPSGDDRMAVCDLPFLDHGKASANVFRKGVIDGHADHAVGCLKHSN